MTTSIIYLYSMHQRWHWPFQIMSAYASSNMNDHGVSQSENAERHENDNDYGNNNKNDNFNENTHKNVTKMVLVHLGKTAGSSITCMLHPSLYNSGKGNSQCDPSDYQPSAISNIVNKRIHLETAPVQDGEYDNDYDDFLITMRNPIERIVSWFYYIHPSYPPQKFKRHIDGCDGYSTIFQCWDSIQAMAEDGLRFDFDFGVSATEKTETNSTNNTTIWTNRNSASKSECELLAQELVIGTRKCWHNYYNYNFTYGRLLQQEAASASSSSSDHQKRGRGKSRKRKRKRKVTIYAIRTEHLEEDWREIDRILGGAGSGSGSDSNSSHSSNVKSLRKNSWGGGGTGKSSSSKVGPNKTLSYAGRSNLCRALCNEIQIYKGLLQLAINIDRDGENESLDELIATCPDESREIRDCALIRDRDHDHNGLE